MKVSVSVVTFNHGKFIGECLASIVAQQTRFPFEVIVGEDASTDGTRAIVERFAREHPGVVRPLFHAQNLGPRRNWQAVLDACTGEYVAHLDGDDRMLPGKLQQEVDFLDAHPETAQVFHRMRVFESGTERTLAVIPREPARAPRTFEEFVRRGTIHSAASGSQMFRRSALDVRLDEQIAMVLDWSVRIAVSRHGPSATLDEVLGEYRVHPASAMRASFTAFERHARDMLRTVELAQSWGASGAACNEARAWVLLHLADRALLAREYPAFQRAIEESAAHGPLSRAHAVRLRLARTPRGLRVLLLAAQKAYALSDRLSARLR